MLAFGNKSVSRVAHVLLLRSVADNMDVNTLASKRAELIGNAAIVRKRRVIHKKSTCVCLHLPVVAFTRKCRDASFDLCSETTFDLLPEYIEQLLNMAESKGATDFFLKMSFQ